MWHYTTVKCSEVSALCTISKPTASTPTGKSTYTRSVFRRLNTVLGRPECVRHHRVFSNVQRNMVEFCSVQPVFNFDFQGRQVLVWWRRLDPIVCDVTNHFLAHGQTDDGWWRVCAQYWEAPFFFLPPHGEELTLNMLNTPYSKRSNLRPQRNSRGSVMELECWT